MGSGGGGGKGGAGGSRAHDYYGTIAGAVCSGVVDALVAVILDGKEVWPNAKPWAAGQSILLNELRGWGGRTWKCVLAHTSSTGNAPPSATYWTQYFLARGVSLYADVSIDAFGPMRIYWGTTSQTAHPKLQAAGNEFGEDHPDYKGVCYIVLQDFLFGRERTSAPNVEIIVQRAPEQSVVTGGSAGLNDAQANVIASTADVLTHWNGLGLSTSLLHTSTFQDTADALQANAGLTACSPLLDSQKTVRAFFNDLAMLVDAWIRFDPTNRWIEVGAYPHGSAPLAYTTLTIDDLTERPQFKGSSWADAKTRALINFNDRTRSYKSTPDKADDPRAFKVVGEHRAMTLTRPFITRRPQAIQHAAETIRTKGRPPLTTSQPISVRRERGRNIKPGDYVLIDIDPEPGGTQVLQYFRVKQRTIPPRGPIKLTLEADETIAALVSSQTELATVDAEVIVPAFVNFRIIESPVSLADQKVERVLCLVERPARNVSGFQIYFDPDTNGLFQVIGNARGFSCRATLRTNYASTDTTLQITVPAQVDSDILTDNVSDLRADDDQLLAILVKTASGAVSEDSSDYSEIEVCSVSAVSLVSAGNYDLTVLRARRDTIKRSFTTAACEVWIIRRASLEPATHQNFAAIRANRIAGASPATAYFRLAAYTFADSRDVANCTSIAFQFPKASSAGPLLTLSAPTSNAINYPLDWVSGHAYVVNDYVWNAGGAYKCILNHTSSGANTPPNATYWLAGVSVPYPYSLQLTGNWSDANANMVATQIIVQKDGGAAYIDDDDQFTPIGSAAIDNSVKIPENGGWNILLKAVDATGLKSQRVIRVIARGTALKCATPKFYFNGKRVKGTQWNLFGKMKLKCATAGATISFRYNDKLSSDDSIFHQSSWFTYDETSDSWDKRPNGLDLSGGHYAYIEAYASKASYTDSDIEALTINDKSFLTT